MFPTSPPLGPRASPILRGPQAGPADCRLCWWCEVQPLLDRLPGHTSGHSLPLLITSLSPGASQLSQPLCFSLHLSMTGAPLSSGLRQTSLPYMLAEWQRRTSPRVWEPQADISASNGDKAPGQRVRRVTHAWGWEPVCTSAVQSAALCSYHQCQPSHCIPGKPPGRFLSTPSPRRPPRRQVRVSGGKSINSSFDSHLTAYCLFHHLWKSQRMA